MEQNLFPESDYSLYGRASHDKEENQAWYSFLTREVNTPGGLCFSDGSSVNLELRVQSWVPQNSAENSGDFMGVIKTEPADGDSCVLPHAFTNGYLPFSTYTDAPHTAATSEQDGRQTQSSVPLGCVDEESLPVLPEFQTVSLDDLMALEPFSPKKESTFDFEEQVEPSYKISQTNQRENKEEALLSEENIQLLSGAHSKMSRDKPSARKRGRRVVLPVEEKKARRRLQNRLAARRCRERKRKLNVHIDQEYHHLVANNSELCRQVEELKEEKTELEKIWRKHVTICPLLN